MESESKNIIQMLKNVKQIIEISKGRDCWKDEELKEIYEWKNEFDFSSWAYDDSQEEIYQQFKYYLERGVDPEFVIETMKARSDDGWYPRRTELLSAKILTK